ncbi:MAG: hypothetical protein HZB47_14755 [Nitrosomonadales bacterium]|nr:hypothetical protein [Nitrosomonadales bacterium]
MKPQQFFRRARREKYSTLFMTFVLAVAYAIRRGGARLAQGASIAFASARVANAAKAVMAKVANPAP